MQAQHRQGAGAEAGICRARLFATDADQQEGRGHPGSRAVRARAQLRRAPGPSRKGTVILANPIRVGCCKIMNPRQDFVHGATPKPHKPLSWAQGHAGAS